MTFKNLNKIIAYEKFNCMESYLSVILEDDTVDLFIDTLAEKFLLQGNEFLELAREEDDVFEFLCCCISNPNAEDIIKAMERIFFDSCFCNQRCFDMIFALSKIMSKRAFASLILRFYISQLYILGENSEFNNASIIFLGVFTGSDIVTLFYRVFLESFVNNGLWTMIENVLTSSERMLIHEMCNAIAYANERGIDSE